MAAIHADAEISNSCLYGKGPSALVLTFSLVSLAWFLCFHLPCVVVLLLILVEFVVIVMVSVTIVVIVIIVVVFMVVVPIITYNYWQILCLVVICFFWPVGIGLQLIIPN